VIAEDSRQEGVATVEAIRLFASFAPNGNADHIDWLPQCRIADRAGLTLAGRSGLGSPTHHANANNAPLVEKKTDRDLGIATGISTLALAATIRGQMISCHCHTLHRFRPQIMFDVAAPTRAPALSPMARNFPP